MTKLIDPIDSAATRGARAEAMESHQSMIEAGRWRENHKSVVRSKRRTEIRLRIALAALQQIYDVCGDNEPISCDARMALAFVRSVAGDAFERATNPVTNGNNTDG